MVIGRSHSIRDYPGQITGLVMLSALVGALAALFTTPKTGYESRARMKERGRKMKHRWHEYMRESAGDDMGDLEGDFKSRAAEAARGIQEEAKEAAKSSGRNQRSNSKKEGEA